MAQLLPRHLQGVVPHHVPWNLQACPLKFRPAVKATVNIDQKGTYLLHLRGHSKHATTAVGVTQIQPSKN
jgi:hypothetical protein